MSTRLKTSVFGDLDDSVGTSLAVRGVHDIVDSFPGLYLTRAVFYRYSISACREPTLDRTTDKSLLNTEQHLDILCVERDRPAVRNWVQNADLRPTGDAAPDHIVVDGTVIQVNNERH